MIWRTNSKMMQCAYEPENPYFRKAYDFLKLWQGGQDVFTLQTSGSTGAPKLITVNRTQLSSSAAMTGKMLDLGEGTKALVCLNVGYIAGLMMLVRGMELGWELTIVEPSANPIAGFDNHQDFDFIAMVPAQLATILEDEKTTERVNKAGKILLGGAPVSVSLLRKIELLKCEVYQSYGMTETVSHVALRKLNGIRPDDTYRFLPGVRFGLDARGCLYVSGPMSNDDKIQTNDLVEITSDDTFRWLGRADNIINSGGVKIVLDKIDGIVAEVLYDQGQNVDCFSWYENDEKLGQKLVLIAEGLPGDLDESTLLSEIRKRVSAYETPKHVYFVPQFAKTPTDKIDKRVTAELLFKSING